MNVPHRERNRSIHRREAVRAAFVLHDLLACLIVAALGACVLTTVSSRGRAHASLGQTISNLRQINAVFASYGQDYQDRVMGYSWTPGNCPSQFADLKTAGSVLEASANQAVDIMRRRSASPSIPRINSWIPQIVYWHLIVADYLDTPVPHGLFQSPEDAGLLARASDPANWHTGTANDRWALSTSYEITAGCWGGPDSGPNAVSQHANAYNLFTIPGGWNAQARILSEVAYPSQKAMVYDRYQWHFGPRVGYFMYDEARVPVGGADGSVVVRGGGPTINPGWQPQTPTVKSPSLIKYDPAPTGLVIPAPPPLTNPGGDLVKGRLRFTRGGLAGRDFEGPEVP